MSAERKVFGKLQGMAETPPDLIEIQTKSYQDFLQADVPPAKRADKGLQAIFKEIFPVVSYDGRYTLDFVGYNLSAPKKPYLQALMDGETYCRPRSPRRAISRRSWTARPTAVRCTRRSA